jgi:hypothetical protein
MKDKVYIRDEQAPELTIAGVPCRKIGEIKNNETKTFQIEDGEQQIFLIADKFSKNYCHGTVTVPAGQEDVTLSGVHNFVLGSNPFCFDGVELTAEERAKQKKAGRVGLLVIIVAMLLGAFSGRLIARGLLQADAEKTYTADHFSITMDAGMENEEIAGYDVCYRSRSVIVFGLREEKRLFPEGTTLEDYGGYVLEANGKTGTTLNRGDGFVWLEYTAAPDGQEIYYLIACCQGEDAFWIVNFATPAENRDQYKDDFLDWAKTVEVD